MNTLELIQKATEKGVLLFVEEGKLGFKLTAPSFDPQLKAEIVKAKDAIVEVLTRVAPVKDKAGKIAPRPEDLPYIPASAAQQRIWTAHQLGSDGRQYNLPRITSLEGRLDRQALEQAVNVLVERHSILRTHFVLNRGHLCQVISPFVRAPLETVNPGDISGQALDELLQTYVCHEFDLQQGPLFRIVLIERAPEKFVLLFNIHHILTDAWSNNLLMKELALLYNGYAGGPAANLPALPVEYADYACWQQQQSDFGPALDYWQQELANAPVLHQLPLDHDRPAVKTSGARRQSLSLTPALSSALKQLANDQGITAFVLLQTAFSVLIGRWSNQKDIVIGSPVSGRHLQQVEALSGLFVNVIAIRCRFDPGQSFAGLLQQQKIKLRDALIHQDLPFEMLLAKLQPGRGKHHSPLFQILFTMKNREAEALSLTGLETRSLPAQLPYANYDIDFSVNEGSDQFHLSWNYACDLFEDGTISRLSESFVRLLGGLSQSPDTPLGRLPVLPDGDSRLLQSWHNNRRPYPRDICVHQLFEQQVEKTPDELALVCGDSSFTYREVNGKANALALHLREQGIKPGHVIPVLMSRGAEVPVSLLALLKLGAVFAPLDLEFPASRLQAILENFTTSLVLTNNRLAQDKLPENFDCCEVNVHRLPLAGNLACDITSQAPMYVIHTSGTTGTPKGAINKHLGIVNRFSYMDAQLKQQAKECVLQTTYHCFDSAIWQLLWPLCHGGRVVMPEFGDGFDLAELVSLIRRYRVSFSDFTPSTLGLMLNHLETYPDAAGHMKSLKTLIVGGEASSLALVQQCRQLLPGLTYWNAYGPTETAIGVIFYRVPADVRGKVPIGKAMQNVRALVLDEQLQQVAIGVTGELYLGGDCLGLGYLNNPAETAKAFIDNPFSTREGDKLYKTGDYARWLPDGNLDYLGRVDNQLKIRGMRIETDEIETLLCRADRVQGAAVKAFGRGDNLYLVAYLVPGDAGTLEDREKWLARVRQYAGEQLPDYMLPRELVCLEKLPVNNSGKTDYKQLAPPVLAQKPRRRPGSKAEKLLLGIWSEILQQPPEDIGTDDDFFDLGGHSLSALRLMNKIDATFATRLTIKQIFEMSTIIKQAQLVAENTGHSRTRISGQGEDQPLRMSSAQQRLWFIDQMGGSSQYNITMVLELTGQLNFGGVTRALEQIMQRHQVLRTFFVSRGEEVELAVQASYALPVTTLDLSAYEFVEQQEIMSRLIREESDYQFDLANELLLRVKLLTLADNKWRLLFNIHHIICDGWSFNLLLNEFKTFYNAYCNNETPDVAPLPIQYSDYAHWQSIYVNSKDYQDSLAYWQQRLHRLPALHQLPLDKIRPRRQRFKGKVYKHCFASASHSRVQALCQQQQTTLFTLMQTVFALFIGRISNQRDVVMGTPSAGRSAKELEGLIGLFVNTLVIRTQLEKGESFTGLLQRNKQQILNDLEHEAMPFDVLVEQLNPGRHMSHAPLFQIMFTLQNRNESRVSLTGLKAERVSGQSNKSKFDLNLSVVEDREGLNLLWQYDVDLFAPASIERMNNQYVQLLHSLLDNPELPVDSLNLSDAGETRQLHQLWQGDKVDYPASGLLDEFARQVARQGDAVALQYQDQALSFSRLDRLSDQLALELIARGAKAETIVGIHAQRSLNWFITILGVLKSGAAYLPLDAALPLSRIEYMVTDSQALLLLSDAPASLARMKPDVPVIDISRADTLQPETAAIGAGEFARAVNAPQDLAYVIYTSGSTGKPKGVCIEHRALSNLAFSLRDRLVKYGSDLARWGANASFGFDASLQGISQLALGSTLVLIPQAYRNDPRQLADYLQRHRVTMLDCTPSQVKQWIEDGQLHRFPSLVIGGEAISADTWQHLVQFQHNSAELAFNVYGPTESCVDSTLAPIDKSYGLPVIGGLLPNVSAYVVSEGQVCPAGVVGELYLGGAQLARGYLNREQLTQERFVDFTVAGHHRRMYRTGDLVKYNSDGSLVFIGRADNQVKLHGYRIELGEIEVQLRDLDEVEDVAVTLADSGRGQELVAYTVLSPSAGQGQQALAAIRQKLTALLPAYMQPTHYQLLRALPLNVNGKLDTAALPEITFSRGREQSYQAPENELEASLCRIWQDLLKIAKIGVRDNFFELGGHSLLITRLINRIRDELALEITVRDVFEQPTIRQIACLLAQSEEKAAGPDEFGPARQEEVPELAPFAEEDEEEYEEGEF
ncbi:non-ribosomal peptide synthetase [Thalassomonas viridans]|uniref:Non-ribosomal peptide synthetase n=1 Tax=Thalassomonas viridans TaxID=137584 RepID=A0AAE9Z9N2_9GAMM|nr:non-ribosomal peptide synthetase [Thalassomonas viridans]WDE09276.1 non-ribosomal peptide synthetase [Thalassomonas viridans]